MVGNKRHRESSVHDERLYNCTMAAPDKLGTMWVPRNIIVTRVTACTRRATPTVKYIVPLDRPPARYDDDDDDDELGLIDNSRVLIRVCVYIYIYIYICMSLATMSVKLRFDTDVGTGRP